MRVSLKTIFIILVFALSALSVSAGENEVLLQKGNTLYQKGNYKEALNIYKQIFDKGLESSVLYYNLGNAYFKTGDVPSAIIFYEKAKRLDPADDDIDFNLKVSNQKIIDKTDVLPQLFYQRWWNNLTGLFSLDGWAIATIVFFAFTLFLFAVYFATRSIILRKVSFYVGIVIFLLSILSIVFALQQHQKLMEKNEAIIFTPSVTIKSSPDEKGQDLFILHEGTKVGIIDNIGEWTEIRLSNGSVGWMRTSGLEVI